MKTDFWLLKPKTTSTLKQVVWQSKAVSRNKAVEMGTLIQETPSYWDESQVLLGRDDRRLWAEFLYSPNFTSTYMKSGPRPLPAVLITAMSWGPHISLMLLPAGDNHKCEEQSCNSSAPQGPPGFGFKLLFWLCLRLLLLNALNASIHTKYSRHCSASSFLNTQVINRNTVHSSLLPSLFLFIFQSPTQQGLCHEVFLDILGSN